MLGFCSLLEKMLTHAATEGIDTDFKHSAHRVHRYFSTAAMLHHEDEEQDLFTLLASQSAEMATTIHELKQDHIKLEEAWNKLEPFLARPSSIEGSEAFSQTVNDFCSAYRTHIKKEEAGLLAMAEPMLSTKQLKAIGNSMKARRQPNRSDDD